MHERRALAHRALQAALRLRCSANRRPNEPLCPLDLAEELGVEVRFAGINSLEAMYVKDRSPTIIISADRPLGRQRFSCAHELGHHVFGHGSHLSSLNAPRPGAGVLSDEEYLAQVFAGFLLLPKAAVSYSFEIRGWQPRLGIETQYYVVSGALGVSYEALVWQCESVLRLLSTERACSLRGVSLPALRRRISGFDVPNGLTVVDHFGLESATDILVDDLLLAPAGYTPVNSLLQVEATVQAGVLLKACRPGLSGIRQLNDDRIGAVRISRRGFVGRSIFRHLEDEFNED